MYSLIKESELISSLPTFSYFAEDFMQAEAVVLSFRGPNKRMSITFSDECQKGRSRRLTKQVVMVLDLNRGDVCIGP